MRKSRLLFGNFKQVAILGDLSTNGDNNNNIHVSEMSNENINTVKDAARKCG